MSAADRAAVLLAALFAANCAEAAPSGEALYRDNCAACHQLDGGGAPFVNPPLIGSPIVNGDAEMLALWVLEGSGAAANDYASEYDTVMPGFPMLSDEELAALLSYIRTSFGEELGPVSLDDVKAARK